VTVGVSLPILDLHTKHEWSQEILQWLLSDDPRRIPMCSYQVPCKCGAAIIYKDSLSKFYIEGSGRYTGRQPSLNEAIAIWRSLER